MNEFPENFCVMPWISAVIPPTGGVGVCCVSAIHRMDNGKTESQLGEIRNSATWKNIRQSFIKGEWPASCEFCQKRSGPENRGHDMRRIVNEKYKLKENYRPEDFSDEPLDLLELEISFGNICNFKCRMCSAGYSSKWVSEAKKLNEEAFHTTKDLKVFNGDFDVHQFMPYMKKLKLLQIKGGEPFLNPKFKTMLKEMVRLQISSQCEIYVITNGSVQDEEILELMGQFKTAHIAVSMEGQDPIYSYIRTDSPGEGKIVEHLFKIMSYPNILLTINYTFQIYNMLRVYQSALFFSQFTRDIILLPVMQDYLHFKNAPLEIKENVKNQISNVLNEIELSDDSRARFESALKNLDEPRDLKAWNSFLVYTNKLDEAHKSKFTEIEPDFSQFF